MREPGYFLPRLFGFYGFGMRLANTDCCFAKLAAIHNGILIVMCIFVILEQPLIDAALPFLEIRHIFVHSDGKPNSAFLEKYPAIQLDEHNRLLLKSAFTEDAYNSINNLLIVIDNDMISKNYISASEYKNCFSLVD